MRCKVRNAKPRPIRRNPPTAATMPGVKRPESKLPSRIDRPAPARRMPAALRPTPKPNKSKYIRTPPAPGGRRTIYVDIVTRLPISRKRLLPCGNPALRAPQPALPVEIFCLSAETRLRSGGQLQSWPYLEEPFAFPDGCTGDIPANFTLRSTPMAFTLPELPYPYDALAPYMSRETLEYHHDKHHQAYVTACNNLSKGTEWEHKPLEEVVVGTFGKNPGLFNNAAQNFNHIHFWKWMKKGGGGDKLPGKVEKQLTSDMGPLAKVKEDLIQAGVTQFGSGWA